jgi:hydroxymethylbilane synthase
MLPAPGQGALAVEARRADADVCRLLGVLDHAPTRIAATTERGLLAAVGGGCAVPIGARARVLDGEVLLDAGVFAPDGRRAVRVRVSAATADDAVRRAVAALVAAGAREILACMETGVRGGVLE